ncbi:unnamed protein product [Clavelina lepadiformis]|uniref:Son of sevenless n=1 Tax=Clavelina lepadiformis TaxID=159417 RepID=A0ABP0GL11_CLALP
MDSSNETRFSGTFISSITKIQQARHGSLSLSQEAVQYLDHLLIRLLVSLLQPFPKNLQEAQEQLSRKFPEPLSSGAIEDAKLKMRDKSRKKVHISVDKVHHILKDLAQSSADKQVSLFFAALLEYMLFDILKLTANYVENISMTRKEISEQDVKIAMYADKVLVNIFQGDENEEDIPLIPVATFDEKGETSYATLVRALLAEEQRYLRDLHLIIKIFKKAFTDNPNLFTEADIDIIFGNIEDIAEMSTKLIVMLEEAAEMTDESNPVPLIGNCFEELAEECSFELYSDYAQNITKETWDSQFRAILRQTAVNSVLKAEKAEGFRDMVTYVLPHLLVAPIYHGLNYFDQIQVLQRTTSDEEDKDCFCQTVSAISPIKLVIEGRAASLPKNRPSEASLRISWKGGVQAEKMKRIENSIEGWVGKTITQMCNEFIYEGDLVRISGKRSSERRVFLFDSLMVCCKSNQGRRPMPSVTMTHEFRLKEKILLRRTSIQDDEQSGQQFIVCEGETRHLFVAHSEDEKRTWMSHLVRLQYRSVYDHRLDQLIRKEAQSQPLRLPSEDKYRFAVPDTTENIIIDDEKSIPSIKGGTVLKLVERLTYHEYYDSSFTKTFLTTFRSFCKPQLLLDFLIERFNIPEPPPSEEQQAAIDRGEIITRDDLKRFRNEFAQPIQLRVMNVLRQWLEYHWYDFEADQTLLKRVEKFVSSVHGKNMQKWARTMQKIIMKKNDSEDEMPTFSFAQDPPPVEWHLTHDKEKYTIMTLHPIEIARQLTLLEFAMYRKVQPSELVGTVWTKAGKEANSPNLLKMIHSSTTVSRWLSKSIVEAKNFEERTSVMSRAVEIMQVLKQLNNFNGLLEFVAAFNSSAIHRLHHTKQHLPERLLKALRECMDLCDPRLTRTLEKLRSCDPPCVPFVGTFLTNILKTEEGNPHLLPNYPEKLELINFAKRRMVASILFDIQQYQNQPYNLIPVPEIQEFLTGLSPLKGFTEKQFNDYLFACSQEIEPRHAERAARFPRTLNDKEMKSPGTVPSKRSTKTSLYRDESKISLLDRRNSVPDEEPVPAPAVTPEAPVTPVKKEPPPPPRPPRQPMAHDLVSAPPVMGQNVFSFDHVPRLHPPETPAIFGRATSIEEDDNGPPPLPPRDDYWNQPQPSFPPAELEFFHNQADLFMHHPMHPYSQGGMYGYNFPEPDPSSEIESGFNSQEFTFPTSGQQHIGYPSPFNSTPPPPAIVERAPPVPPRDPPVVPPRDDTYSSTRYVPDPMRFASSSNRVTSNSHSGGPPPIPRRQPSAPSV